MVARFPNTAVALPHGVVSARVLFDGTNGFFVNTRTRVSDRVGSDAGHQGKCQQPTFTLTARTDKCGCTLKLEIPRLSCGRRKHGVCEHGWLFRCQLPVLLLLKGSCAHWVFYAVTWLAVRRRRGTCWSPTIFTLKAGGQDYRFAHMYFFIFRAVSGAGENTVTWVGFEMLHRTRQLGISQLCRLVCEMDVGSCSIENSTHEVF